MEELKLSFLEQKTLYDLERLDRSDLSGLERELLDLVIGKFLDKVSNSVLERLSGDSALEGSLDDIFKPSAGNIAKEILFDNIKQDHQKSLDNFKSKQKSLRQEKDSPVKTTSYVNTNFTDVEPELTKEDQTEFFKIAKQQLKSMEKNDSYPENLTEFALAKIDYYLAKKRAQKLTEEGVKYPDSFWALGREIPLDEKESKLSSSEKQNLISKIKAELESCKKIENLHSEQEIVERIDLREDIRSKMKELSLKFEDFEGPDSPKAEKLSEIKKLPSSGLGKISRSKPQEIKSSYVFSGNTDNLTEFAKRVKLDLEGNKDKSYDLELLKKRKELALLEKNTLTGEEFPEADVELLQNSAFNLNEKPFDLNNLISRLQSKLDAKEQKENDELKDEVEFFKALQIAKKYQAQERFRRHRRPNRSNDPGESEDNRK